MDEAQPGLAVAARGRIHGDTASGAGRRRQRPARASRARGQAACRGHLRGDHHRGGHDAGGASLAVTSLAVSVLITLVVVYWLAEQYAELLGQPEHQGRLPGWARVRTTLADSWPMVSASFAPLVALVLARLAGAPTPTAATVGVAVAIALPTFHGWSAARAAQLRGWQRATATAIAAGLGLIMVIPKNVVIHHLH
jgi:hypothetical protein